MTALLSASLMLAGAAMPVPAAESSVSTAPSGSVEDGSLSEEDAALQQAQAAGQPVEVVVARTEVSDVWANPDGSFSTRRYGAPVRVMRGGAWVATDPTLQFAADGTVVPKAAAVDVTFSGGGTGPLLSGIKDGRTLSLSWPSALPKPTLQGNVAMYSEILPGVDLQLKAEIEGFSQLIVVKNAQAAANPALATLKYRMSTVGLNVSVDAATKTVEATDPAGQNVFTSPSPLMWDSSTTSAVGAAVRSQALAEDAGPGDVFEPAPGAQDAEMATAVNGSTLEITPDQELLTGADTAYPVYIDPSWAWGERDHWTRVYKKYPDNSYWDSNEVARVGYENETNGLSRSFFQFDIGEIKGAKVKSSTFRIRNVWSWSCQDRPVEVWHTGKITKRTTWNQQPAKHSRLATVDDAKGWRGSDDCPAGALEFDVTSKLADAAGKKWNSITLGMYASNEGDTFGWKKFDPKTAVLETKYNNPPRTPYGLGTNPKTSCSAGGTIGNTTVSVHATLDDLDAGNLTAEFQVFKSGSATPVVSETMSTLKRRAVTLLLPAADTPSGSYTWKVRAKDHDNAYSAWSQTCKFTIDRTRPSNPPKIGSPQFPDGSAGWPTITGKARTPGTFTLTPNGVTDVVSYRWWTDFDPDVNSVDVAKGGSASVTFSPPGFGPHRLFAYTVDSAGNRSDTATYLFYATRSRDRDAPGDLNGDTHKDIWAVDSNGTLLTYAGQGTGKFSAATNGGQSFDAVGITYRTDWGQDGYTDLITLEDDTTTGGKRLWSYPNNGTGIATTNYNEGRQELHLDCPFPTPPSDEDPEGCEAGYNHWHDASQVVAPGDINGDSIPDLLVKQGNKLWAYYGHYNKRLDAFGPPTLVGGTDWDKFTVVAPGDTNGDTVPDIWLRDDATGDIWRSYGTKDPSGKLDLATWGTTGRVKLRGGLSKASVPDIGSVGDLNGDDLADLWIRKTDNSMHLVPGLSDGTLGSAVLIDGANGGVRIPSGTTITPGQTYSSASVTLELNSGKLLVKANATGKQLWSTNTTDGTKAVMQSNGNLVLYKADDSTVAWQSKTSAANGYALLQDRGNLVIHNAKGHALWSSGTHVRKDFNGDGRSDIASWYAYTDGHDRVHNWYTNSDGTFQLPALAYQGAVDSWVPEHMKRMAGDFNGDGRGDIAVVYGYATGAVAMFTWLAKADGTFSGAVKSWQVEPGRWTFSRMYDQVGDYNGDGRDDVSIWYDYADGSDKIFTFTAGVDGRFNAPFSSWYRDSGYTRSRMKTTSGDFNGDGRDDLAAFYSFADGRVSLITFPSKPDGGFDNTVVHGWESDTWGSFDRTFVNNGDFNGDGRDDIVLWYDYVDGSDAAITFTTDATNAFGNRTVAWSTTADAFTRTSMQVVTGDYNGDGRDDLGALYGRTDGSVKTYTWTAKTDGHLNAPVGSAEKTTGWNYENMSLLER
ncbi:FG-GAP-like repeat-containing protein [Streptomyces abyssomicinicus]|uniref:FG-GAP-like repeat-containing protein n=1 Tax=Streptomyces abyssomicinicus TaxID=574929 RepID=UPI00124FCDC5|nr:FG-GAP-like repeat-containing protein [Streptomyces abyssomicinicus]